MSVMAELLSLKNPSPALGRFPLKGPSFHASPPLFSVKVESLNSPWRCRASMEPSGVVLAPKGLGFGIGFCSRERRCSRLLVPFAASHEESKQSDIEVEKESDDLKMGSEESEEAWKQTLESFKEQALKLKSVSQEAFEVYSQKAMVVLKETSEKLKIQTEKARNDLAVLAKEINVKELILTAAEKSPEPVKEVVETFTSSKDNFDDISKLPEFYFGMLYGLCLCIGGFLDFMFTGSTSAVRFGVILGGLLLVYNLKNLRSYKKEQPYTLNVGEQAVIVAIIFLREMRVLPLGASIFTFLKTITSGALLLLYVYRIITNWKFGKGAEN